MCNSAPSGETNTASAQGVTADEIRLGVISDPGYSGAPGLNQELFDASDVFAQWCNSLGGINGRKIKIDKLDAKITEYQQRILEACGEDFSLVGGGGVFDDTGQQDRLKCTLPDFPGYVVTPAARGADLQVQALPFPLDTVDFGLARYLTDQFPDSITKVGWLTGNYTTTIVNKDQYKEAATKAYGWQTVYDDQYNSVGEPTWTPFAQALKDKGVKGLYYVGEPANLGKLMQALAQIDYKLDWIASNGNMYDQSLLDGAGSSVDTNTLYVQMAVTPFLAADKVPAVAQYEELFKQYLPNGKNEAALGLNSFSAWLLFAQSAKACGADLTRTCLLEKGQATSSWDGGGISAQADPSNPSTPPQCIAMVKTNADGKFDMIDWQTTDGVYNCSPDNVVKLTGDYGKAAKLSDVGKTMADVK